MRLVLLILCLACTAFPLRAASKTYDSYKGLVMAGYQGWFNTPEDGAGRNWHHYNGKNGFRPGSCSIDMWPDVREYKKTYKTEFFLPSKKAATVFSSYDKSTVRTHFKWMKDYGLDGVFMQRFIGEISNDSGKKHFDTVLQSAMESAREFNRAIAVMYDLSGMDARGVQILLKDAEALLKKYELKDRKKVPPYLYHKGRPLIVVWGVGFNDNRKYGIKEAEEIIDGLHGMGYSVMLGVPTYWRRLSHDTVNDPELHRIIKKCEVIMPWFVGRYDIKSYPGHKESIKEDISWCRKAGIDYAPLCFPGFSWKNMMGPDSTQIDRHRGQFFWHQIHGALECGAGMLYIAMFDEIDEATAIFKCARKKEVPLNGSIGFTGIEDDLPTDHYLWLAGQAGRMLRKERPLSREIPARK